MSQATRTGINRKYWIAHYLAGQNEGKDLVSSSRLYDSIETNSCIHDPDHVARIGNFHVVHASPNESWITVGETLPHEDWQGNTLLGRIFWNRTNDLADFYLSLIEAQKNAFNEQWSCRRGRSLYGSRLRMESIICIHFFCGQCVISVQCLQGWRKWYGNFQLWTFLSRKTCLTIEGKRLDSQ